MINNFGFNQEPLLKLKNGLNQVNNAKTGPVAPLANPVADAAVNGMANPLQPGTDWRTGLGNIQQAQISFLAHPSQIKGGRGPNANVNVTQVRDENGIPLRQSQITIPVGNGTQITNPGGFTFQSLVKNPADGTESLVPLTVLRSEVKGKNLNIFVDGPVSNGSVLNIAPEALSDKKGKPLGQQEINFNNRKFMSSEQAALWGKAFEPTNPNLFPPSIYGGQPSVGIPQSTDPAVVRQDLQNHFQKFVDAKELSQGEMNRMLKLYDNEKYRQSFIDPTTGQFEPQLMASVLSTAGTPGEGSIAAIIGGKNPTGRPGQVRYGDLAANQFAQAEVIKDANGQDQWVITLNSRTRNEPFQVNSALIAHEAMHQDNVNAQDEEVIAKTAEINTWKQQLLVNPQLATVGTPLSKVMNLQVLIHENSGKAFPKGGLFEAPLAQGTQDAVPNSDALNPRSLEDYLRNNVYAGVEDVDTAGNRYLDNYLRQMTRGRLGQNNGFNDNTVARLDNTRFFNANENFRILQALQLRPVIT